jgi:hypothetical protein
MAEVNIGTPWGLVERVKLSDMMRREAKLDVEHPNNSTCR